MDMEKNNIKTYLKNNKESARKNNIKAIERTYCTVQIQNYEFKKNKT